MSARCSMNARLTGGVVSAKRKHAPFRSGARDISLWGQKTGKRQACSTKGRRQGTEDGAVAVVRHCGPSRGTGGRAPAKQGPTQTPVSASRPRLKASQQRWYISLVHDIHICRLVTGMTQEPAWR